MEDFEQDREAVEPYGINFDRHLTALPIYCSGDGKSNATGTVRQYCRGRSCIQDAGA